MAKRRRTGTASDVPATRKKSKLFQKQSSIVVPPDTKQHEAIDAEQYALEQYRAYGEMTLEDRAIPALQDGLKPVQRRALYAMWNMGARQDKNFRKSAAIVGEMMQGYHPHGDKSCYDTIVNMVNPKPVLMDSDGGHPFSLVEPQGNYGGFPGFPAAASRYTEARLSKIGMIAFEAIDVANMIPNFDGTRTEPSLLPIRFPLLLLMGTEGIAVGARTVMPRHGLPAVLKAVRYVLGRTRRGKESTTEGIVKRLGHPDVGHSIVISSREEILRMYKEGKGTIRWCCEHTVRRGSSSHEFVITSFAPGFSVTKFMDLCDRLKKANRIMACNDESDKNGPRLTVQFRDPTVIEDMIIPAIQTHQSYQWNVQDRAGDTSRFIRADLRTFINAWLAFARKTEKAMLDLALERSRLKLAREQARLAACQNSEKIGSIMGNLSLSYEEKVATIIKDVKLRWRKKVVTLTEEQVEYLLDLKIRAMNALNAEKQTATIKDILSNIRQIKIDLSDVDGVVHRSLHRIEKDCAKVIKKWRGTTWSDGVPAMDLPSDNFQGYWSIEARNSMVRAHTRLSQTRGKWVNDFLVPKTDCITVVTEDGKAHSFRSGLLSKGKLPYKGIVGVVTSTLPYILVVDSKGGCGVIRHEPLKKPTVQTINLTPGTKLVAAYGMRDSDTVIARGTKVFEKRASRFKARRPGSKAQRLIPRSRGYPSGGVFVVPDGGCIVENGVGAVDNVANVSRSATLFAVGRQNYTVDLKNNKRVCPKASAVSIAVGSGIQRVFILR